MDSVYHKLDKADIISRMLPALQSGYYIRDTDQKITANVAMKYQNDWIFSNKPEDMQCVFYSHVMFKYFKADFSSPPTWCQGCYKTVCNPKKITDLFKVIDIQRSEILPAKAGIETRNYVHALYGAYWYSRSLSDGKNVRKHVAQTMYKIDPSVNVFLKRGCTEMESYYGNPNKWQANGRQAEWERLINKWVDVKEKIQPEAEYIESFSKKRMIEWAASNGDSSYLELTRGAPLHMMYEPIK